MFSKNAQLSNFMKIRPVETELFTADRRTYGQTDLRTDGEMDRWMDMTELIVAFRNFANAPKHSTQYDR